MDRLFIDANILVDVLLGRENFLLPSQQVLSLGVRKKAKLFCAEVSLSVIYYLGRKGGMSHSALVDWIRKLLGYVRVADSGHESVLLAVSHASEDFADFEDALQYAAAQSARAQFIVTRNPKDYKYSTIPVVSPVEYLALKR